MRVSGINPRQWSLVQQIIPKKVLRSEVSILNKTQKQHLLLKIEMWCQKYAWISWSQKGSCNKPTQYYYDWIRFLSTDNSNAIKADANEPKNSDACSLGTYMYGPQAGTLIK